MKTLKNLNHCLLSLIFLSLLTTKTLSQEKKVINEVEEMGNVKINKDYWKSFETGNPNNSKTNQSISSPLAMGLMKTLEIPFDIITVSHPFRPTMTYKVELISKYFKIPAPDDVILRLRVFDKSLNFKELVTTGPTTIKEVKFFEETIIEIAQKFIDGNFILNPDQFSSSLEFYDRLSIAEVYLENGIRSHDSGVATGKREGSGWNIIRKSIANKITQVRISKIRICTEKRNWDQAIFEISKLSSGTPQKETLEILSALLVEITDGSNQSGFSRTRTKELITLFLSHESKMYKNDEEKPLLNLLKKKSEYFYLQAEKLNNGSNVGKVRELLLRALELQPDHQKAGQLLEKISPRKEMLKIGLARLPEINPTDTHQIQEIHASDLLYESLLQKETSIDGNLRMVRVLTSSKLTPNGNGASFFVTPSSLWSDGKPVTAPEIQSSMKNNKTLAWMTSDGGVFTSWTNLDSNNFEIKFKSGILEPFSFFTFKIIQDTALKNGSGPYKFSNKGTELGKEYVNFKAQPFYSFRNANNNKPNIQEIRFYKTNEPVEDLISGKIDLAIDIDLQEANKLKLPGNTQIITSQTGPSLPNKRVYFIAVNTEKGILRSPEIRKAIAHSLLREKILKEVWIGSEKNPAHHVLQSIFPKDYAISDGMVKSDLTWSQDLATVIQNQSTEDKKNQSGVSISLKFPSGDPKISQAMELIANQIKQTLGITVTPQAIPPDSYFNKTLEEHDYDLAYSWYDYPDENCSLYPLLFSYLQVKNQNPVRNQNLQLLLEASKSTILSSTIPEMLSHRKTMISLMEQELPLIPLWQLDRFWAWRKDLNPIFTDGLHLLQNIAFWEKESAK